MEMVGTVTPMIFHLPGRIEAHPSTGAVVNVGTQEAGTVLRVLSLHPNAWVRADELIRATWQEHAVPAAAKANPKTCLSQLSCALPPSGDANRVEARSGAYRVCVGRDELDAGQLDDLFWRAGSVVRPGFRLTTAGPGGGAVLRIAATGHAVITGAAAGLSHVGVRWERLDGRHASASADTSPFEGGSL